MADKRSKILASKSPRLITRRRVLVGALGVPALIGSATTGYAAGIEPLSLRVTRYGLNPPGWPAGRRLSLTVIADLHAGGPNMGLARVRQVVDVANAQNSDLIVLLGDFVATHRFVTEVVPNAVWSAELARLRAPLGVYTILGNHDWWHGLAGVRGALASAGIPVLENDAVKLGRAGEKFWLAGLGDQLAYPLGRGRFRGVDDLPGTLARLTDDDPAILLVHEPDIFPTVPDRFALTLAGHTHGGQVRVPFLWPHWVPSNYGARFAYGHIVERDRHMIVSGGLGTSSAPIRLGVPPEILRIDLGLPTS
jgi:predicted MPP superfamily phosphohydrolase